MPKIIAVEGQGNLQFGDDWSDEQIDQYIEDKYFGGQSSAQPQAMPSSQGQAMPAAEKQGVWDSFTSGFGRGFEAGGIPFYSGGKEAVKSVGVLSAALAAREGTASDEQMQRLREYKAEEDKAAAEAEGRGTLERIAYGVGRVLGEAPGFAGELALTGGVATAGEKAAVKAAATAVKALGKETAYTATRKAADWAADKVSGRIVRGVAGAAAQTIPSGATRIVSGTAERMTPGFDLEETPGGTYFTETKQADPFLTAAYKALGDQFVEVLSERSGGFLTDMLGAGARKAGLGKAIDWTSGLKQAVASRVAKKYPGMFEGNDFIDAIGKTTKWDGVFGEMLEERAGEVGRAALGVQDYQAPSMEQLATEAIGFGLIDAGFNGARLAASLSKKNLSKEQRDRTQQALDAVTAAESIAPTTAPVRRAARIEDTESGLADVVDTTGAVTPFDRITRNNSANRRARVEAGLTGQSGEIYDLPEPIRAATVKTGDSTAYSGMDLESQTSPVDQFVLSQPNEPLSLPETVAKQYTGISQVLSSYFSGQDVDQDMIDTLFNQAPALIKQINNRLMSGINARVAPRELAPLSELSDSLSKFRDEFSKDLESKVDQMSRAREISQAEAQDRARRAVALQDAIAAFASPRAVRTDAGAAEAQDVSFTQSPIDAFILSRQRRKAGAIPESSTNAGLRENVDTTSETSPIDSFTLSTQRPAPAPAPAAATPTSLPTESSLPVGTGAAPVGGVPVAAPVIVSNGQQKQETAAPSVAPVQPAQTQAAGGTAGAQTTQAKKLKGFSPYTNEYGDVVEQWQPSSLDPNSPPIGIETNDSDWISQGGGRYMWRSMSRAEYEKLAAGQKTYGGGKTGRGNYLAAYPEKSSKWDGEILVEFAGAKPSGETSKNTLNRDNVTKVWARSNGAWIALNNRTQEQGVANANQVQGPVEVLRGQAPQPATPVSEGQPGAVQVAAGAQSKVQKPGTQANAPLKPAVYKDGTPIKVDDTVRWRTAAGKNEVLGKVVSIEDGVPQVRITQLSKKFPNTLKIGELELNKVSEVPNYKLLEKREPVQEIEKKKVGRPSKITQSDSANVAEIIGEGLDHPEYDKFSELMRGALKKNKADEAALKVLKQRVGARASVAMEAAFNSQTAFDFLITQPSVAGLDPATVLEKYKTGIDKWVIENINEESPKGFSPTENLVIAVQNAREKSKIEKATTSASSSVDEEGEESNSLENVPAPSTSGASSEILSKIFGDVEALSEAVLSQLRGVRGKMTVPAFNAAIERAFVSLVPQSNAKAVDAAKSVAAEAAPNLAVYYQEKGLDGVDNAIAGGEALLANAAAEDTGNQSLQQGETTLAEAIDTVLAGNSASSWMRGIAEKLLKAKLRARVVVLSDAEFDRIAPRPGQSAFYDANPQADTIYIRQSAASHDYLVMHEAVHAATVYALRTNVSFRNEVRRLRDAAVNALGANSFYGLQEHGSNFNNLAEFVGESMSSQEFRDALNGVVDKDGQSLWTKFLNLIGRLFGFKGEQKTLLDQIVNLSTEQFAPNVAISEGDQGVGELMSAPQIESAEQLNDLTSVPGLNAANIAAIENLAATQAQMIPASIVAQIATLPNTVRRSLNWLIEQAGASQSPKPLSSMPTATWQDEQAKHEAAHAVDKLARNVENERSKVLEELEKERQQYATSINGLKANLASANAEVAATTGVVDNLVEDYKEYVDDVKSVSGALSVAQKTAIEKESEIVRRTHKESDQMRKAISAIAEGVTDADLNNAQSNDDIVNIIATRKMLDGKVLPETINTLFTVGSSGKTPLQSMRRLIPALKMIKKINSNIAGVKVSVDAFEKAVAGMTGNKQRKVNPRAFARLYRRVLQKQSKAIEEARLLDNTINRMERKILKLVQELDVYDNLVASPEFSSQYEEAIRSLNILSSNAGDYGGAEGAKSDRKVTYKIGSQLYTIEYSADPAVNANNNAVVMSALAAIEAELKKPLSPIDRYKLMWMRTKLTLFSNPMGDAALAINSFDIINRLRVAIPILTPLIDRAYVLSLMPGTVGKELRILLKVSMSVASGIEAARMNPRYGEYAINLAVDNAIKSHPGLDARTWDKEVLNEFLGSNQERTGRNLKVGDTTAFGHVITKEDVKAAELQARFADAIYKAARGSENGGIAMYYPTLVQESFIQNGEKRTRYRYAYAGGAFTTPMILDRSELPGSVLDMAKRWYNYGTSPSSASSNRLALLLGRKWFVNFALKHVMEMSPLYKRNSPYAKIYQALADRYASTGKLPGTLDDLVNDIDAMTPAVGDELIRKAAITQRLVDEISQFVESYLTQVQGSDRDEETAALKTDALSANSFNSIISGSNNFTKPRGDMVAPSNFYNFTLSSDSAKGVIAHSAMMPIRMRQLALMGDAKKAFEAELAKINDEIKSRKGSAGYLNREWTEPKRNVLSGKAYLNQGQLRDLVTMINNSLDVLKQTLEKPAVGRLQTTAIEDMLQVRRVMLVAQLTSAIMNFTQAVTAGQFTPSIYLQGYKPKSLVKQSLLQIVRGAWDTAAALSSENKAVSGWLKANKSKSMFLMRKFAERTEEFQRMQARSNFEGFAAPRLGVFERARIIRQLGGYGSPVEGFADSKGSTSQMLESVFSKWFLPHVALAIQNIPASVDRVANLINLMSIQDSMNLVMRSGISIMEKRAASGAAGWDNWSDPKNLISEAEADAAGWQRETLVNMRQAFSGLGGLERVLHDYWLRVQAAKAAGTSIDDVPPIADEGFNRDVSRELLGMTNAAMEGMRPEAIQGRTVLGRIYNFLFTFSSWVNRYFSTLGNLTAVDPKRGYINFAAYSAVSMALLLTVLAISGAWNNEIRGFFYEFVKGRPYAVTRVGDVLRDTTPGSIAKLAAASIGLMVPYAGESIANLVGGQTYRNSPTDIASFSQSVQLAKTFSSAIESGMKTGDWTGTLVNTLRQTVPGTDAVLNRLPGVRAADASADAGRAARVAAGPLELSDKGGQGGTPTKFSNLVKKAEAAASSGNLEEARSLLEQAAEEKKKTGGTDPYGAVKSAIAGRSVDRKTFGRKLTDDEREGLLSRMSDSQRAAYQKAEDANKALASLVPESGSRGEYERVGGKPKTAIDRMNSKFRKIRRSATPKALRTIKTKMSKLKPKKLKISKPKSVSGSRLLRPKARAAGAFALRPASM